MYTSVLILTIIYVIFLIYIFIKYNLDEKSSEDNNGIYREKLDISASEAAYLVDKNSNSLDLIFADLLSLIEKKYIKMDVIGEGKERDYIFTKIENANTIDIKSHELSSYKIFFKNKDTVSIREYLRSLENNSEYLNELEFKIPAIKNDIEYELRRQKITDENAEKKLFKINKFSIWLVFIFLFLLFITMFTNNTEIVEFSIIGFLFSILLNKTTNIKEDKLTKYGAKVKKQAEGFKNYLRQNVISDDKPLYMVNILEYNYNMAVAFGFAKLGENEFVHKTYKKARTEKVFRELIKTIIIISIILVDFWFYRR